jgi:CRISPR-associated protein Cas1
MNRNYYLFNPGRLRRQQNTIFFERYKQVTDDKVIADFEEALENEPEFREEEPEVNYEAANEKKVIPIEDIDSLYVFGEADFNKKFLNYCGQKHIPIHLFNYYGFYSGTFYPREFLNSGELLIRQVQAQLDKTKRLELARAFVSGAAGNIVKNLQYYNTRGKDCSPFLNDINPLAESVSRTGSIDELMGIEGNIRQIYYRAWPLIIDQEIDFTKRVKHPPENMVNALISFGNSMVYTTCLAEIYRTQLNPLISYLHEPGTKRFSLSLDLAEIFKPLLADRLIFTLLNKKQLSEKDFKKKGRVCWLTDDGRKLFVKEFDERLGTTIKHRRLNRNISYRRLIRLECYKLIKHLLGQEAYEPFVIWW